MGSAVGKRAEPRSGISETHLTRRDLLALSAFGLVAGIPGAASAAGPRPRNRRVGWIFAIVTWW